MSPVSSFSPSVALCVGSSHIIPCHFHAAPLCCHVSSLGADTLVCGSLQEPCLLLTRFLCVTYAVLLSKGMVFSLHGPSAAQTPVANVCGSPRPWLLLNARLWNLGAPPLPLQPPSAAQRPQHYESKSPCCWHRKLPSYHARPDSCLNSCPCTALEAKATARPAVKGRWFYFQQNCFFSLVFLLAGLSPGGDCFLLFCFVLRCRQHKLGSAFQLCNASSCPVSPPNKSMPPLPGQAVTALSGRRCSWVTVGIWLTKDNTLYILRASCGGPELLCELLRRKGHGLWTR